MATLPESRREKSEEVGASNPEKPDMSTNVQDTHTIGPTGESAVQPLCQTQEMKSWRKGRFPITRINQRSSLLKAHLEHKEFSFWDPYTSLFPEEIFTPVQRINWRVIGLKHVNRLPPAASNQPSNQLNSSMWRLKFHHSFAFLPQGSDISDLRLIVNPPPLDIKKIRGTTYLDFSLS